MASYSATNSLTDLNANNPTGAEDSGKIDDALRETRLVFKTVMSKAHRFDGALQTAIWKDKPSLTPGVGYPAPAGIDTWHARSFLRLHNIGSIDTSTNSSIFTPIAGSYLLTASAVGFRLKRTQIRLYNITNALVEFNCVGSLVYATNDVGDDAGSEATSTITSIFATDGTKSYRLEQIHQANNIVNGWGTGLLATSPWNVSENVFAQVTMLKIA